MITKAEKVADGTRPMRLDRFVEITVATKGVDWALVERARQLAGLKGYVTNLPIETMDGAAVIAAYHDLWQVEQSFRMTKSDLRARPVSCRRRHEIGYADVRVTPTGGVFMLVSEVAALAWSA